MGSGGHSSNAVGESRDRCPAPAPHRRVVGEAASAVAGVVVGETPGRSGRLIGYQTRRLGSYLVCGPGGEAEQGSIVANSKQKSRPPQGPTERSVGDSEPGVDPGRPRPPMWAVIGLVALLTVQAVGLVAVLRNNAEVTALREDVDALEASRFESLSDLGASLAKPSSQSPAPDADPV